MKDENGGGALYQNKSQNTLMIIKSKAEGLTH